MGITSLVALALAGSSPIQYKVQISSKNFKSGEPVRVELTAQNTSKKEVVLAKAIWDGAPAAAARGLLTLNGEELRYEGKSSSPLAQVAVSDIVDKSRFVTLKPGESTVLYWTTIDKVYDFGKSKTRTKADYSKATLHGLRPGTYNFSVSYSFSPNEISKGMKRDWNRTVTFAPGAEKLWKSALVTGYSSTLQFKVR